MTMLYITTTVELQNLVAGQLAIDEIAFNNIRVTNESVCLGISGNAPDDPGLPDDASPNSNND